MVVDLSVNMSSYKAVTLEPHAAKVGVAATTDSTQACGTCDRTVIHDTSLRSSYVTKSSHWYSRGMCCAQRCLRLLTGQHAASAGLQGERLWLSI